MPYEAGRYETLTVDVADHIAHVQLSRPDALNTMNEAFWRELPDAFDALSIRSDVRVAVLSSTGRHFTAGLDLSMGAGFGIDQAAEPARWGEKLRHKIRRMQDTFTALERCRVPVIAAVQGGCLGGGVDLVTACDLRYATADAYFTIQEVNIAIVADVGTLQRIPHLLPLGLIKELAYTGRKFTAEEAARHGFVNAIADSHDGVVALAMDTARTIAAKSPVAIAGIKDVVNHAREHTVRDGLEYVSALNTSLLATHDVPKGVQAAMARKEATYDDLLD